MPLAFSYRPPGIDAAAVVHAAAVEAAHTAAETILEASQQLVPVDTGALKASGRVVDEDGPRSAIVYGAADGAGRNGQDTAAYAVPQHERLDYAHEQGQAKFLETPLHTETSRVADIVVVTIRRALP